MNKATESYGCHTCFAEHLYGILRTVVGRIACLSYDSSVAHEELLHIIFTVMFSFYKIYLYICYFSWNKWFQWFQYSEGVGRVRDDFILFR